MGRPGADDEVLEKTLLAARDGDRDALAQLVASHVPPLKAFVRVRAGEMLFERESIDDLVQSVCREALADLSAIEYRSAPEFRSWLFLLATRKILDRQKFYRRERRDVACEVSCSADEVAALLDAYESVVTPSRVASAREELGRIELAIGHLPDSQRDAVAYVKLLGVSYAEVAVRMETTVSAVRGLVARGLATLAERLRRDA